MGQFSGRVVTAALVLALGACAGEPTKPRAVTAPERSLIEPAQKAIDQASGREWAQSAPAIMGAARQSLATARSIVLAAARANRGLTASERQRVKALVEAVQLDLRAAKAKGALASTRARLARLEGGQRDKNAAGTGATQQALQADTQEPAAAQPRPSQRGGGLLAPRSAAPALSAGDSGADGGGSSIQGTDSGG